MTGRVVLLNGVGSVGKSSVAKAIQAQARDVFLHVQMDTFLEMMPVRTLNAPEGLIFETTEVDGMPVTHVRSGPAQSRALVAMRHAIAAMADQGCNMVVDDVLFEGGADEYRALLKDHNFRIVGLHAPLDVVEARERARGDRTVGLARAQFDLVHRGMTYDLEIDTAAASPEACAQMIVDTFDL